MMMHRMSPLMASDDSDADLSLTPPSPDSMTKQHGSPETLSKNGINQDVENVSDRNKSPTEQKNNQKRTYSYMSPISSDVDDIPPEKPQRRDCTKQPNRQSITSLHQEKPKRKRSSIKKTQSDGDRSPAKREPELEDGVSEESQKEKGQARIQARISLQGSDTESRSAVTGMGKASKRQNCSHVSTDRDSESFSGNFTKKAPTCRKSKREYRASTEKVKRTDLDNSRARGGGMSKDEDVKNSSDNEEDVEEKPKKRRVKKTPKQNYQAVKLETSDFPAQPTERLSPKKKHGQVSRKTSPIKCEICSRSIRCKAILKRHMLTHTGEKPFECAECGKRYTSSSNLRIHQLSHSGKMDYVCSECGQKFTHLPYLKRHLLRHSGKKMHICEHCGKGFFQKYHLLRHILVHTGKTLLTCDKCGMSFNRKDYLKLHLRNVHLIDITTSKAKLEKHKCEMCDKFFANPASLETHKRIHTGVMPFSCTTCSRKFKQSSHLYSHMMTHSSEKPHPCNLCELKFTRKNYLRKHKERVHSAVGDSQSP